MVNGDITNKFIPGEVNRSRVKISSVLCAKCGKMIHSRCAGMKRDTANLKRNLAWRKCEMNTGEAVEQEEKIYDGLETVREFTYLGDSVGAGGGCRAAMTARTRHREVKIRECSEFLHGSNFPLKLKGAVYKSFAMPEIQHRTKHSA